MFTCIKCHDIILYNHGSFIENCTVRQVPQGLIEKPVEVWYDPVTVKGLLPAYATGEDTLWEGAGERYAEVRRTACQGYYICLRLTGDVADLII